MQHSHELPPPPAPTWRPAADVTPVFQRFRQDEGTLKALTLTQVELYKLRMAHNRLATQAADNQRIWEAQKGEMEDQVKQLLVRSAEAERLFNDHMAHLLSMLQGKQHLLSQIQAEHELLQGKSAAEVQALQQRLEELQRSCEDLQARKAQLQDELHRAGLSAELGRKAQQRVAELEGAVAAMQRQAQDMISDLQQQRQSAELQRDQLQGQLQSTQTALVREGELREQSEHEALQLAVHNQRLSNALEVERLINAPLYDTDHASTTLSHVLRSAAAPSVAAHTSTPRSPTLAALAAGRHLTLSPNAVTVSQAGRSSGNRTLTVRRPEISQSFADRDLTRLGRSWATTTTAAGHPHPAYMDNIDRWRETYDSAFEHRRLAGVRASSVPRSGQAGKAPSKGSPVPVFFTPPPQRRQARKPDESVTSTGRTLRY